jgi:hypothetical protein
VTVVQVEAQDTQLTVEEEYELEIAVILSTITSLDMANVGPVIETCMGLMGRCTEIHIDLSRRELTNRKAKVVRTLYLRPVMDLIEFVFRGGSRLTEVYRQELEMSK